MEEVWQKQQLRFPSASVMAVKVNHTSETQFAVRSSKCHGCHGCHGCQKVGHIVRKKCPEKEQKRESGKKKWKPKSKLVKRRNSTRFVSSKKVRQSGSQ